MKITVRIEASEAIENIVQRPQLACLILVGGQDSDFLEAQILAYLAT